MDRRYFTYQDVGASHPGPPSRKKTINDRPPNFRSPKGKLYLVRCFACEPERGTENYAPVVASGVCAWCGWKEDGNG